MLLLPFSYDRLNVWRIDEAAYPHCLRTTTKQFSMSAFFSQDEERELHCMRSLATGFPVLETLISWAGFAWEGGV